MLWHTGMLKEILVIEAVWGNSWPKGRCGWNTWSTWLSHLREAARRRDQGRWALNSSEWVSSPGGAVSHDFYFLFGLPVFSKISMYFSNKGKIQLLSTNKINMDTETPGWVNTTWTGRQRLGEVLESQGLPETGSWGNLGQRLPRSPRRNQMSRSSPAGFTRLLGLTLSAHSILSWQPQEANTTSMCVPVCTCELVCRCVRICVCVCTYIFQKPT